MTTTFVTKNPSTQLIPPKFSDLFFLVRQLFALDSTLREKKKEEEKNNRIYGTVFLFLLKKRAFYKIVLTLKALHA